MERLRVARQPDVSWDSQRGRLVINWRIPREFQPLMSPRVCKRISRDGAWYRDRFAKDTTPAQAARLKAVRLAEYHVILDAAKARLAMPEGQQEASEAIRDAVEEVSARWRTVTEPRAAAEISRLDDMAELARLSRRTGVPVSVNLMPGGAPAVKVVASQDVIDAWIAKRKGDKDEPKDPAINNKRSKLAKLFAFLAGVKLLDRLTKEQVDEWLARGNLATVTEADIRRYRLHLLKLGGRRQYDHMVDLSSLFGIAREYILIDRNPMAEMSLPAHISGRRPAMTLPEAKAVLLAAREAISRGDVLQWAHPLAYFGGGAINSEILEARSAEFRQLPDDGPFPGRWVWDLRHRRLKDSRQGEGSGYRNRIIPLHPTLIEWGFPAYVAARKGKPLFDGSLDSGTNRLNSFIADMLAKAGFGAHRTFYCWRHTSITKLGDDVLAKYVCGHASDLHARYIHLDTPRLDTPRPSPGQAPVRKRLPLMLMAPSKTQGAVIPVVSG